MKHFFQRLAALLTAAVLLLPPLSGLAAYAKLERGMENAQVLNMQLALASLGYNIKTDGKYGMGTQSIVKQFQRKYGLTIDGVAGDKTLSLLFSLAPAYAPDSYGQVSVQPTAAPYTGAQTVGSSSAALTAVVNTPSGSLNLRNGPSSSARVLCTIPYGDIMIVVSRGSTWCSVIYNGTAGYVMTRYLAFGTAQIQPTASPRPAQQPTQQPMYPVNTQAMVTTTGGSLNLRESPDSKAKVISAIPYGAQVTVLSRGVVWCTVVYNGMQGFVMTSFLRFEEAASPTPAPTAAPTPTPAYQVEVTQALITTSGGTLNLREQPSSSARVVLLIPNASSVTVYSRGSEWSEISYQGVRGYVMSRYLTFLGVSGGKNEAEDDDPSAFTRILKKGMTGADVAWAQSRLMELGYLSYVSNIYDDATFAAVKSFQQQNGLETDGNAGSQTFAMLKSGNARRAGSAPLKYSAVRIDQKGSDVRQIQTDLKTLGYPVTVSGEYDEATHNAVVAFQQRNGLVISGIADALTRQVLHGGGGKPYSTPVAELPQNEGRMTAPARSQMKLLRWNEDIKPSVRTGQTFTVYDPNTGLGWKLVFYSLGHHADSQPATWRDTQIMNRSFGDTSWTIHPVYVMLPGGQWTMATMHNRPHLYGSITDNGFGGHLCVHFLRDMAEAQKNDPNYGVNNQVMLRNAWKALTGETVN